MYKRQWFANLAKEVGNFLKNIFTDISATRTGVGGELLLIKRLCEGEGLILSLIHISVDETTLYQMIVTRFAEAFSANSEEEREVQPVTEVKKSFDASPRPFLSLPNSHLRDGSIVLQNGQVGYLSNLKRQPTFHPMDLPYERLTKLKAYIEIRESYHRLYDYEANNRCEDSEERIKLNRLYDDFVSRWGYLNQKSNTDLIKMDATAVSYTHLDVYKRQVVYRTPGLFFFFFKSDKHPVGNATD